jgi:hypothetical protein
VSPVFFRGGGRHRLPSLVVAAGIGAMVAADASEKSQDERGSTGILWPAREPFEPSLKPAEPSHEHTISLELFYMSSHLSI